MAETNLTPTKPNRTPTAEAFINLLRALPVTHALANAGDEPTLLITARQIHVIDAVRRIAHRAGLEVVKTFGLPRIAVSGFDAELPARESGDQIRAYMTCPCGASLDLTRERASGLCVPCAANLAAAREIDAALDEINGEVRA